MSESTGISVANELDYCPTLRQMLDSGEVALRTGEKIKVAGTSTLNNLRALRYRILEDKPVRTLEIGLAYGASALAILGTLHEQGNNHLHVAIDPYQASSWQNAAVDAVHAAGFSGNFQHIAEDSAIALPKLCIDRQQFGLIYVDGSHLFEDVFIDFFYSARLLELGGVLFFDDCSDKHVNKVIKFIKSNYSQILEQVEPLPTTNKSITRQIAHSLGIRQLCAFRKVTEPPRNWNTPFARF